MTATRRLYRAAFRRLVAGALAAAAGVGLLAARAPASQVRVSGQALADQDGPFTVVGATLFWGAWGFRHDRARLEANLQFLADQGVDAIRVLAAVGPSSGWEDRTVDPAWPDYDAVVAGLTDLAFDRYGLRVQWTIFGGVDRTPTPEARAALVARVGGVLAPRAHKVLFVEIANEGYQNGFAGPEGLAELGALARSLRHGTPLLVALTAPQNDASAPYSPAAVHRDTGAHVAVLHHDRDVTGDGGAWKPVRAPWSVVGVRDGWPPILASNEPIGPGSSVSAETDPARLAGAALVSWLAGHSVYVLHAGPGVRGGGQADRERGRASDYFDDPSVGRALAAVTGAQALVPADIANWTPLPSGTAEHPFGDAPDVFCAARPPRFICVVLAPDGARTLTSAAAIEYETITVPGGVRTPRREAAVRDALAIEPGAGVVVIDGVYRIR